MLLKKTSSSTLLKHLYLMISVLLIVFHPGPLKGSDAPDGDFSGEIIAVDLTRDDVLQIQNYLIQKKYDWLTADGILGPKTRVALLSDCSDHPVYHGCTTEGLTMDDIRFIQNYLKHIGFDGINPSGIMDPLTREALLKYCSFVPIPSGSTSYESYRLTESGLKELETLSLETRGLASKLSPFMDVEFATPTQFQNAVEKTLNPILAGKIALDMDFTKLKPILTQENPPGSLLEIDLKKAYFRCGCSPDISKTIYGICAPHYKNDGLNDGNELKIDFSLYSRIGYFAYFMNDWESFNLKKSAIGELLTIAHRHQTKVDLIIKGNVDTISKDHFTYERNRFFKTLLTRMPRFDGITLFIDKQPDKPDNFKTFLYSTYTAIHEKNPDAVFNLMFSQDTICSHVSQESTLLQKLFRQRNDDNHINPVDFILVILNEPTTIAKKTLRDTLEKEFQGEQRRIMLRKIIPVIIPPYSSSNDETLRQFNDDLVYFEDNFGGVGFWPLPSVQNTFVSKETRLNFQDDVGHNIFKILRNGCLSGYCVTVCPARAWVIGGLVLLTLALAGFSLSSEFVSEFKALFNTYLWAFIGLIFADLVLLFSLVTCVPAWTNQSDNIIIVLVIALILYLLIRQIQKRRRTGMP
jgi:hypothetical protein